MHTIIETISGKVQGREEHGLCVCRGIPYARPPVDALRFQAPARPAPWGGVRDATRFASAAPQNPSLLGPMTGLDVGTHSEDCLYLNVWTRGADNGKRPVMVWLHGGAFMMGAGSQSIYDGAVLARRGDVVIVTINYRLGALGFLHLQELCGEALPVAENLGLLDQIAALEWVRDNIGGFGGDPSNVTLFGESAGAISVATMLATPRARGLFHRAILQSGSANFVASRRQATRVAEAFLHELGVAPPQAATLRTIPVAQLLDVQRRLFLSLAPHVRGLVFQPVIDGSTLPHPPFEAIGAGVSREVAVLIGTNLDEMKLFGLMDPQARGLDDRTLVERCERRVPGADGAGVSYGRRLVDTYRAARAARGEDTTPPELWFAIDSDHTFRSPAMRLAELQARQQAQTYAYLFTWPSPFMGGVLGACHAIELPFVFGTHEQPMLATFVGTGPAADRLAQQMQDAWIAFAHTGAPGHDRLERWPAYDAADRATMLLGATCQLDHAPREPERSVWEAIR